MNSAKFCMADSTTSPLTPQCHVIGILKLPTEVLETVAYFLSPDDGLQLYHVLTIPFRGDESKVLSPFQKQVSYLLDETWREDCKSLRLTCRIFCQLDWLIAPLFRSIHLYTTPSSFRLLKKISMHPVYCKYVENAIFHWPSLSPRLLQFENYKYAVGFKTITDVSMKMKHWSTQDDDWQRELLGLLFDQFIDRLRPECVTGHQNFIELYRCQSLILEDPGWTNRWVSALSNLRNINTAIMASSERSFSVRLPDSPQSHLSKHYPGLLLYSGVARLMDEDEEDDEHANDDATTTGPWQSMVHRIFDLIHRSHINLQEIRTEDFGFWSGDFDGLIVPCVHGNDYIGIVSDFDWEKFSWIQCFNWEHLRILQLCLLERLEVEREEDWSKALLPLLRRTKGLEKLLLYHQDDDAFKQPEDLVMLKEFDRIDDLTLPHLTHLELSHFCLDSRKFANFIHRHRRLQAIILCCVDMMNRTPWSDRNGWRKVLDALNSHPSRQFVGFISMLFYWGMDLQRPNNYTPFESKENRRVDDMLMDYVHGKGSLTVELEQAGLWV